MGAFLKVSRYIFRLIHAYLKLICTESPQIITKTNPPVYNLKRKKRDIKGEETSPTVSEIVIKNHTHLLKFMFRVIPDCYQHILNEAQYTPRASFPAILISSITSYYMWKFGFSSLLNKSSTSL